MHNKRIIFIVIFIIAVLGIGFLLYFVFFRPEAGIVPGGEEQPTGERVGFPAGEEAEPGTQTGEEPGAGLPAVTGQEPGTVAGQTEQGAVRNTISDFVVSPNVDSNGRISYYSQSDGKFYRLNKDGTLEELSDQTFFNVENVTWSPTSDVGVIEYPDGANIYYNFQTGEQKTLPKHWEEFSFSQTGDKIAAKSTGFSADNSWLVTSDADGNNVNLIEPLGENADKVTVDWSPNNQVIGFSKTGEASGANRQEILLIGENNQNFKSLIVEGRGFQSKWSPSGQKLLYSVYGSRTGYKPELWIVNAQGDNIGTNRTLLNINTWPDKCAFRDEVIIYCAVPENLSTGSGLSPELAQNETYNIFEINTNTGILTHIPTDNDYNINNIFLSDDGTTIHFNDYNRTGIFSVNI